jgi:hypothetical protein
MSIGTVQRHLLTPAHMTCGGEKTHPVVIDGGRVKEWIGFTWIDGGRATPEERAAYPQVVDNDEDLAS